MSLASLIINGHTSADLSTATDRATVVISMSRVCTMKSNFNITLSLP